MTSEPKFFVFLSLFAAIPWSGFDRGAAVLCSDVTGGPIRYAGAMSFQHRPHGRELPHLEAWLDLWRRHYRAHLPADTAVELIVVAESIGERIRRTIAARGGPSPEASSERCTNRGCSRVHPQGSRWHRRH